MENVWKENGNKARIKLKGRVKYGNYKEEWKELYFNQGHSFNRISSMYNVSITAVKNVFSDLYSVANWLHNALLSALGDPAATFAVYQSYHETDRWSSNLWVKHNNGSGITYAKQKGAYIVQVGLRKFAGFKTKEDWLAAYIHELTKKLILQVRKH